DPAIRISPRDVPDDPGNRRLRAPEIEACYLIQRSAPRRRHEHDQRMPRGQLASVEAGEEVAVLEGNAPIQTGDVATCELEHLRIELEGESLRGRHVTEDPVKRVAGSGKRRDDGRGRASRQRAGRRSNVAADTIAQDVAGAFHGGGPRGAR